MSQIRQFLSRAPRGWVVEHQVRSPHTRRVKNARKIHTPCHLDHLINSTPALGMGGAERLRRH